MTAVFRKALRDSRRTIFWLAVGFGLYILFLMTFYPTIVEQADDFNNMLNSYPDEFITMFLGEEVGAIDISAPGTFIHIYFGSYGILILGTMAIAQAFNAVTNAERDGTLDVMLSLPIARRAYLMGRLLNTLAMLLIVLTVCFVVYLGSSYVWPEFDIAPGDLAAAIYGAFFPLAVTAGFAYLLATFIPSSKPFAGGLAYLFLIGSYLVHGFSGSVEQLEQIRPLLLFDYYNAGTIVRQGIDLGDWGLLSAVGLVYMALAWWRIDKKELGV